MIDSPGNGLTQKVTVYFTHSTPFQAFLTALGIGKDAVPLRADNYYQQTQRNWRTSLLSPFAANLAVVLYRYVSSMVLPSVVDSFGDSPNLWRVI